MESQNWSHASSTEAHHVVPFNPSQGWDHRMVAMDTLSPSDSHPPSTGKEKQSSIKLRVLILNMLNCFKDYKSCIHILYHTFYCIQQKKTIFTMKQPYMLVIIHYWYHACWCLGDLKTQAISRHGIDQININILYVASEELRFIMYLEISRCSYQNLCIKIHISWPR